jgi:hypothetical protein
MLWEGVPQNCDALKVGLPWVVVVLVAVNDDGVRLPVIASRTVRKRVVLDVSVTHVERVVQWDDVTKVRRREPISNHCLSAAQHALPSITVVDELPRHGRVERKAFRLASNTVRSS